MMISGGFRAEFFNLGARQAIAIASHRHIMGSGSTGSKSKVLVPDLPYFSQRSSARLGVSKKKKTEPGDIY